MGALQDDLAHLRAGEGGAARVDRLEGRAGEVGGVEEGAYGTHGGTGS